MEAPSAMISIPMMYIVDGKPWGAVTVKRSVRSSISKECSPAASVRVKVIVVDAPPTSVISAVSVAIPSNLRITVWLPSCSPMHASHHFTPSAGPPLCEQSA